MSFHNNFSVIILTIKFIHFLVAIQINTGLYQFDCGGSIHRIHTIMLAAKVVLTTSKFEKPFLVSSLGLEVVPLEVSKISR